MGKKRNLKPHIFQYLNQNGNSHLDLLINNLNKEIGVPKEKIRFRIKKLASKGELLIKYNVVSRIFRSKSSNAEQFDESYNLGSITIGKKDNIVRIQSEYGTRDIKDIQRNAKQNFPFLKKDLEDDLKEIESLIINDHDPLDVLGFITSKNSITDPETDTESSFKGKQLLPETIQNIILKNDHGKYSGSNRDDIGKFHAMAQSLDSKLNNYILTMALTRDDLSLAEAEVFFHVISNSYGFVVTHIHNITEKFQQNFSQKLKVV